METMQLPPPSPSPDPCATGPRCGTAGMVQALGLPACRYGAWWLELALSGLRMLWMVMSLPQAWKLGENLSSSSLRGARGGWDLVSMTVCCEPCQLTCRQGQSQSSSSPPLPLTIRSDWSLSFPLAIALWPLCCCIGLFPASCPCPLLPKAHSRCLLQRGLPGVPSPGKHCP